MEIKTLNRKNRKRAIDLKALAIDEEGKIILGGNEVRAIPIARPSIVFVDKETRKRGYFRQGYYGYVEQTVTLPLRANAYILGESACEDRTPIQFYKILGGRK